MSFGTETVLRGGLSHSVGTEWDPRLDPMAPGNRAAPSSRIR